MLPAKQAFPTPVVTLQLPPTIDGSLMLRIRPWRSRVGASPPARPSAVGMLICDSEPGSVRGSMSCDQKKNSLSRLRLKSVIGSSTGPPSVYVVLLYLYSGGLQLDAWPASQSR